MINLLQIVPAGVYQTLGGAIVVSLLLQAVKHKVQMTSDKVITFTLASFSFLAAGLNYLAQVAPSNPKVLALQTFLLMGASNPTYRYLIKPAYNVVVDAKKLRDSQTTTTTTTPAPDAGSFAA
jgi:hypothetical protein